MAALSKNGTELARIHKPFSEFSIRSNGWILRNLGWGWKRYKKSDKVYTSNEPYSIPLSYRWRMREAQSPQELYDKFREIYPKFTLEDAEFWFPLVKGRK